MSSQSQKPTSRSQAAREIAETFCIPAELVPVLIEHLGMAEEAIISNNSRAPEQVPVDKIKGALSLAERLLEALADDRLAAALRARRPMTDEEDEESAYESYWLSNSLVKNARLALEALEAQFRVAIEFRASPGPSRDELRRHLALYFFATWIRLPTIKQKDWKGKTEWTRAKGNRSRAIHARGSVSPAVEFICECMKAVEADIGLETLELYALNPDDAEALAERLMIKWTF